MKLGTHVLAAALLTLVAAWGLSGCAKNEPGSTTTTDTHTKEAAKGDEHAQHADAKKAAPKEEEHDKHAKHGDAKKAGPKEEEHSKHDHNKDGHKRGEHKDHKPGGHGHQDTAPPQGKIKVGDKVPDFAVRSVDGKSVKLSELQKDAARTKSGIVVLSFWCTTCHSCRDVEKLLAKLHKDFAGQAAVMALTANADETGDDVAAFLKKSGLDLPVVLDPSAGTADLFGVNRTTTTVVIDGNGVLRYVGQFRQKNGGSAEDALKAVLAGKEVAIKTTPHNG